MVKLSHLASQIGNLNSWIAIVRLQVETLVQPHTIIMEIILYLPAQLSNSGKKDECFKYIY